MPVAAIVAVSATCLILAAPKVTLPKPFPLMLKSMLVSPPVADTSGALPVAAFVTSIWFTAYAVV